MTQNNSDSNPIVGKVETSGTDAAIVSTLFLTTFLVRAFIFHNLGYVVGGLFIDAILFAIGYQIAKRLTSSIISFRVIYTALFIVLVFSGTFLKR